MTSPPWRHRVGVLGRILSILGVLTALTLAAPQAISAPPRATDLVKIELLAEQSAPAPGSTLWLDLHLAIAPGWHTYWRNPGDAGVPTTIAWTLPPGLQRRRRSSGRFPSDSFVDTIGNYGYSRRADLLVPIIGAGDPARRRRSISPQTSRGWCVPTSASPARRTWRSTLAGRRCPARPTLLRRHASPPPGARLPQPRAVRDPLRRLGARFAPHRAGGGDWPACDEPTADFFPDRRQCDRRRGSSRGRCAVGGHRAGRWPSRAARRRSCRRRSAGVLVLRGADGVERGYHDRRDAVAGGPKRIPLVAGAAASLSLGGVDPQPDAVRLPDPVAESCSASPFGAPRRARDHHGLAYTAGVMLSFAALGGVLLALRAGGAAVGWGFQLQSPVVVGAARLSDVGDGAEPVGGRRVRRRASPGSATGFAGRDGLIGAFFTGVLATRRRDARAPRRSWARALGFALIAPAPLALAIFVALGVGLAAPIAGGDGVSRCRAAAAAAGRVDGCASSSSWPFRSTRPSRGSSGC